MLALPWKHQPVDLHRRADVLQVTRAQAAQRQFDLVLDLACHVLRNADSARFGQRLDAGGDIDAVAMDTVALGNDITQMQTDAHFDPAIR